MIRKKERKKEEVIAWFIGRKKINCFGNNFLT